MEKAEYHIKKARNILDVYLVLSGVLLGLTLYPFIRG